MKQKLISILLVIVLALSMVGCGNTEQKEESKVPSKSEEKKEESNEVVEEVNYDILPWTGEEITYTLFMFDNTGAYDEVDENTPAVKKLQEMMGNIKFEYQLVSREDYDTKLPLYLASGEMPDIMIVTNSKDTTDVYGSSGVLLDWSEYFDYMPNVVDMVNNTVRFGSLVTADGSMYAVPSTTADRDWIMTSWFVNSKIMDELGLKIPETQEEFLEYCRTVKKETDVTPLMMRMGWPAIMNNFALMYRNDGDRQVQYYKDEGKWDFGPTREASEFKDYVTFLNTLYEEGLLDKEAGNITRDQCFEALYNGNFGIGFEYPGILATNFYDKTQLVEDVYEVEFECFPTPKGTGAWLECVAPADGAPTYGFVAREDIEHPEVLAAVINMFFSEEFKLLKNYGIEGETYEMVNGKPQFVEEMSLPSTKYGGTKTLADVGLSECYLFNQGGNIIDASFAKEYTPYVISEIQRMEEYAASDEYKVRYSIALPSMTEDEMSEYSEIMAPVKTYLDECTLKFIMGEMDIETEWDTFMENLVTYGDIDRAMEILNSKETMVVKGSFGE